MEILHQIFIDASKFCRHSYDPSICILSSNTSGWLQILRFKKGLPLVCKALYWSGIKALYNDVVLRRMGQIVALAETLRLPEIGEKVCLSICHLRMDARLVLESCVDVVRTRRPQLDTVQLHRSQIVRVPCPLQLSFNRPAGGLGT